MTLHQLLRQRPALLRQARLAGAAYVYCELGKFAARIARGRLRGRVTLYPENHDAGRAWPALVADEGSQAVIDEHFIDKDILDLADLLVFATGGERREPFTFRIEELDARYRSGLRRELESAGVELSDEAELVDDPNRE